MYINDCIIDPLDWNSPINFVNPNIHVCRSFGLHPKTLAPKSFYSRASGHLVDIANNFPIGGFGPFGQFNSDSLDNEKSPDLRKIINDHQRIKQSSETPILINNIDSDLDSLKILESIPLNSNSPIVWLNINQSHSNDPKRFLDFIKHILPKKDQFFFSINGKCLEYKFANKITHILRDKQIIDKILIGTNSPHYIPSYCGQSKEPCTPLHLANMILELHLILCKHEPFKHYSLADTNDLLNSNAFAIFPRKRFTDFSRRSFENYSRLTICRTLDEYKAHIKFSTGNTKPNTDPISITTSSKRPATSDSCTSPIKSKKQCTGIQTSQPTHAISTNNPPNNDQMIDLSESLDEDNQLAQIPLPTPTQKSSDKENTIPLNPKDALIEKKAFEIWYGDGFWSRHGTSAIRILKRPTVLIENMKNKYANSSLEQLETALNAIKIPNTDFPLMKKYLRENPYLNQTSTN